MPWLWLYGPPGVGKSATGFEVFEQLLRRGERVAFVELDQIGMCMGAPTAARSAAKADNLLGILDNAEASGAEGVVVSGDLAETMRHLLERALDRPTLCRLRADDEVMVERLTLRRSVHYSMSSSAYEAHDVPPGDLDVVTHPRDVAGVAAEVVRRLGPWPPAPTAPDVSAPRPVPSMDDSPVILVTGPRAVGTSAVAWQVLMSSVSSGHRTGYLDLEQLGFLPPALRGSSPATKLANAMTCWSGFRRQGATRLVLCGHVDGGELDDMRFLMPSLRVVALAATPETLLQRARRRSRQKDIWLPGDDLFGREERHLRDVVRRATPFDAGQADLVVDTDVLPPAYVAVRIASMWPGGA